MFTLYVINDDAKFIFLFFLDMAIQIKKEGEFSFVDSGGDSKEVILLLHGLFGALSNFSAIYNCFKSNYRVVIPIIPIVEQPLREIGLKHLVGHVEKFVCSQGMNNLNVLGNSLGGHIAQLFTLSNPDKVNSLILTGSSGLFENSFGGTFLRRGDYDYIRKKAEMTFYDPKTATKDLVDEVFTAVNDRNTAIRLVGTAKSAIRHNLEKSLNRIKVPTLLIWGQNDEITPPFVAEKFKALISNSRLHFIDKCGHAPMMEKPDQFNILLDQFLTGLKEKKPALV